MIKLCVFSSGSKGNCTFIASETTSLLIDFGITCKELEHDLEATGIAAKSLSGVLVTHAHQDHCSHLHILEKHFRLPLFATENTASSIDFIFKDYLKKFAFAFDWAYISPGSSFEIGDLSITPFEVPHDANGAVAYTITDGKSKIGIATDLGCITNPVFYHLSACDALVLEMNHDVGMLRASDRNESLKTRIFSRLGHLSNDQAADFLESEDTQKLKYLFPAHISQDCNDRDLIAATLKSIRKQTSFQVVQTFQNQPSEFVRLG